MVTQMVCIHAVGRSEGRGSFMDALTCFIDVYKADSVFNVHIDKMGWCVVDIAIFRFDNDGPGKYIDHWNKTFHEFGAEVETVNISARDFTRLADHKYSLKEE